MRQVLLEIGRGEQAFLASVAAARDRVFERVLPPCVARRLAELRLSRGVADAQRGEELGDVGVAVLSDEEVRVAGDDRVEQLGVAKAARPAKMFLVARAPPRLR